MFRFICTQFHAGFQTFWMRLFSLWTLIAFSISLLQYQFANLKNDGYNKTGKGLLKLQLINQREDWPSEASVDQPEGRFLVRTLFRRSHRGKRRKDKHLLNFPALWHVSVILLHHIFPSLSFSILYFFRERVLARISLRGDFQSCIQQPKLIAVSNKVAFANPKARLSTHVWRRGSLGMK
jgi:hypothetical protein